MRRLEVPLVSDSGRKVGYGDRWLTHRVRNGPEGPILGQKHVGITIACIDSGGRILVQHRRHKIFDKVWSFSGDTHPYRMYGSLAVETIYRAARRCARARALRSPCPITFQVIAGLLAGLSLKIVFGSIAPSKSLSSIGVRRRAISFSRSGSL